MIIGFAGLITAISVVHELGHYAAAFSVGAPSDQLSFGFCGINPCTTHPAFEGWQLSVTRASGGFLAGGVMIAIWITLLRRNSIGPIAWWIGLCCAALGTQQLANGLAEWLMNDTYRNGIAPTHLAAFIGTGLHLALTRLQRGHWFPWSRVGHITRRL